MEMPACAMLRSNGEASSVLLSETVYCLSAAGSVATGANEARAALRASVAATTVSLDSAAAYALSAAAIADVRGSI